MSDGTGLIAAYILDGKGEGKKIGWKEIKNWNLKLVLEVLYTMKVCDEYLGCQLFTSVRIGFWTAVLGKRTWATDGIFLI